MANMSYCKFQNTMPDLKDCYASLWDDDLSEEEQAARSRLIALCKKIAEEAANEQ